MSNKNYDVILLGAYTKDTIKKPNEKDKVVDGGGFNYGTHIVTAMGLNVASITRLAKEDSYLIDMLKKIGADVYAEITPHSTCLTLEYKTSNVDERTLYVTTNAGSFTLDQVKDFTAKAFVIGPSIRGEVPIEVIKEIKKKNKLISIDVQGYIRVIRNDGVLIYEPWAEKKAVISLADVLKTDAVEAEFLTGEKDIKKAAKMLHKLGAKEIVLTHRDGILVYNGKTYYEAGFFPKELLGRSGRGDTVISSYMAKRTMTDDLREATIWAAAAVSIKMEQEGPFKRNIQDVVDLIRRKYS